MARVTMTRHLALLGGLRTAPTVASDQYTIVTVIGGLNLDLTNAALPDDGVTITKVSLVGGAHVRVPAGCSVDVRAFNLIGRKVVPPPTSTAGGPTARVRAYGLFGGVRVEH